MDALHQHDLNEWYLFTVSTKVSLSPIFPQWRPIIFNSNAHDIHMKEFYENMHLLAYHFQYDKHSWHICGGWIRNASLWYLARMFWYSLVYSGNGTPEHVKSLLTESIASLTSIDSGKGEIPPGQPLVNSKKADLIRNPVKAMDQSGSEFPYFKQKFPEVSVGKSKKWHLLSRKLEKWWEPANLMESEVKLKMRLAEYLKKWPYISSVTLMQKMMCYLLRNISMPTD